MKAKRVVVGHFGVLEGAGRGAGEVEGLNPWFDKDGMAVGTVEMSDLTAGMGAYKGE